MFSPLFPKFRYFRQTKQISLTSEEKAAAKEAVLSFVKTHPVRVESLARRIWQRSKLFHPVPIALGVLLLLGSSTAYAAESALPDEPLYPIKIYVNEPIRAQLALSPAAKADWDTRVTERRLEEAEKLASTGKLTTSTKLKVADKIEQQTERAEQRIETLKTAGKIRAAANVSAHLEASLQKHERLLESIAPQKTQERREQKAKEQKEEKNHRNNLSSKKHLSPTLTATSSLELTTPLVPLSDASSSIVSSSARLFRREEQPSTKEEQESSKPQKPRERARHNPRLFFTH